MWHKLFPLVYERYLAKQIYLAFVFILFALISLFIFFDFIDWPHSDHLSSKQINHIIRSL